MTRNLFSRNRKPTDSAGRLVARVYGIMAATTLGTFGVLSTAYELFFRPDIFA